MKMDVTDNKLKDLIREVWRLWNKKSSSKRESPDQTKMSLFGRNNYP